MIILSLLIIFLHSDVLVVFCNKTPITCNAGIYSVGTPASVVCNFHRDVSVDKLAAIVEHYPKGATADVVGTEVLTCERTDPVNKFVCEGKYGFTLDGIIKEHLTLRIPSVNSTFAGMYMCFTEPAETTQLCTLSLTVAPNWTTLAPKATSPHEGESRHVLSINILISVIVVLALCSIIIVMVAIYKRRLRRLNRQHETRQPEESSLLMSEAMGMQSEKLELDPFLKGFKLIDSDYQHVMELMAQCLNASVKGNSQGGVKTYSVPVHSLPKGTDEGTCLVAELGSTTVKVCRVLMWGFKTDIAPQETYPIPSEIRTGTGLELFSFIADCVKNFLADNNISETTFRLGLIFSFPCAQDQGLTKATVTEWTKGFACRDVVGVDVGIVLQRALREKFRHCYLYVRTVCNDAVGTLIAVASKDTSCKIAVMLGTGFNACCMRDLINNSVVSDVPKVLTKVELGMLGKNGSLERFTTKYDREVNRSSIHPGKHILEQMVSTMYIGEVVRFVLRTLIEHDLLFQSVYNKRNVLTVEGAFAADCVSLAASFRDTSEDYLATKFLLKQLHVENYTDEDCKTVVYVCQVVLKRAAHLAAAVLAALINHTNQIEVNANKQVTIAVDGDLHRHHPKFHKLLLAKTQKLVRPGLQLELHPSYYGSTIGTALLINTVSKTAQTPNNDTQLKTTSSLGTSNSKQPKEVS